MIKKSLILSIISLFTYLISLISQLNIAFYFGASKKLDIFFIASSFPILLGAIFSNAMSYSLIPHLIKQKLQIEKNYNSYVKYFIIRSGYLFGIIVFIFSIGYIFLVPIIYKSYLSEDIRMIQLISVIFFSNMFLALINGILISVINANEKYALSLLTNIFPYLFSIIFVFFFNNYLGVISLAVGNFAGSFISFLLLVFLMPFNLFNLTIKGKFKDDIKIFYRNINYALIAMLCFTFFQTSDSFWASKLGDAKLSYISYSQRILVAIASLIIVGPSILFIPKLTKTFEGRDKHVFLNYTLDIIKIVFAVSSVLVSVVIVYSNQIVKLLFYRGNFTILAVDNVSSLFPFMMSGMTFMISVVIIFRIFFIANLHKTAAYVGLLCAITYFVLSGIFSQGSGIYGIAFAYLITWVVIFVTSIHVLFKDTRSLIFNNQNKQFFLFQLSFLYILNVALNFINNKLILKDKPTFLIFCLIGLITIIVLALYFIFAVFVFKIQPLNKLYFSIFPQKVTNNIKTV